MVSPCLLVGIMRLWGPSVDMILDWATRELCLFCENTDLRCFLLFSNSADMRYTVSARGAAYPSLRMPVEFTEN